MKNMSETNDVFEVKNLRSEKPCFFFRMYQTDFSYNTHFTAPMRNDI